MTRTNRQVQTIFFFARSIAWKYRVLRYSSQIEEEQEYSPDSEYQISSQSLNLILDTPIAYHKTSRKISIKEKGPKDKRNYPRLNVTKVLKDI